MRLLYLHPAGSFGGASKSLIELFVALCGTNSINGTVISPVGTTTAAFSEAGLDVRPVLGLSQFDNTRYSYYRRLRWLILLREILFLPGSLLAIWRIRKENFDILHVNEITLLPLGVFAKYFLGLPMVVHVRSLQRMPGSGWRTSLVNRWLMRYADAVVAIDYTVASTLAKTLPVTVVHNGLRVEGGVQDDRIDSSNRPVKIGFLGVLIPLKGIYELIEAVHLLKQRGVQVECLVAGENPRQLSGFRAWIFRSVGFARDVRADLELMISSYGLESEVKLLGFVSDVRKLYQEIDILCFPSHLNAAGRPVFEAAFFGVPSVVAVTDPVPDAIVHGVTGLAVPKSAPNLIADALQRLAENREYRLSLGRQARTWANKNFSIESNAALMYEIYQHLQKSDATCTCN